MTSEPLSDQQIEETLRMAQEIAANRGNLGYIGERETWLLLARALLALHESTVPRGFSIAQQETIVDLQARLRESERAR